jgi:hypothetical protein
MSSTKVSPTERLVMFDKSSEFFEVFDPASRRPTGDQVGGGLVVWCRVKKLRPTKPPNDQTNPRLSKSFDGGSFLTGLTGYKF